MNKPSTFKQAESSSLSSEGYYSSTAYNTRHGDSLANNSNRLTEEELDGKYEDISENPVQLNEPLLFSGFNHAKFKSIRQSLKDDALWKASESDDDISNLYWRICTFTWKNSYRNWELIKIFFGFSLIAFLICYVLIFLLILIMNHDNMFADHQQNLFLSIFFPSLLAGWLIPKIAMRFCNDNQYGYFNRRTGMLNFYIGKNKPMLEIPFREFTPTIKRVMATSGEQYILGLRARTTKRTWGYKFDMLADCLAYRDFLYQYMDISKPLPDIPEFELCRDKDPVTLNYDRKHKRNPRYWRDKSVEDIETMVQEARKKAWQTWGLKFIKYNRDSR